MTIAFDLGRKATKTNQTNTGLTAIENVNTLNEHRSKIIRNRVFDCHLSPDWRQKAIENTVSSDFYDFISITKIM